MRNLIRIGTIKTILTDFGLISGTMTSLDSENPENITLVNPYGINAAPPENTNCVVVAPFGYTENCYVVAFNANAPVINAGEVIIYNNFGTQIYLKNDGSVEITAPIVKINGDVNITGNLIVDGDSTLTGAATSIADKTFLIHEHSGVTSGPDNTGGVV